jgi:HK97 family phage portal protein
VGECRRWADFDGRGGLSVPAVEEILMDVLARLLTAGDLSATYGPADDHWYTPIGASVITAAGVRIDAEGAKKISAWFRGRDILATSLAMLPFHLYERLPDDEGSNIARTHRLYDVLHRKPNPHGAGDSFTWRRQAMFDLIDGGWAYDWIGVGQEWSLERIDPSLVTPEKLKRGPYKGRMLFHVRDEQTGQTTVHTQDEIFYRMASDGKGILDSARDSLGLARVTDAYASKIFGSGALNAGLIEIPGPMDPNSEKAMAQSFKTAVGDWHLPRVLPKGAKFVKDDGLTPERAQLILARNHSVSDIARWLGMPPYMLGIGDPSFGNAEQYRQDFVDFSMGSWLSLWEFATNDQLIGQPNRFYAEFKRAALVRGNLADRWAKHVESVNAGIESVDEVRGTEGLKKRGGKADELREPQNITGKPRVAGSKVAGGSPNAQADEDTQLSAIATAAAGRVLRKEIRTVQALAVKHASDQDAFAVAVTAFYAAHADLVAATLHLTDADVYCAGQAAQLLTGDWMAALRQWDTPDYAAGLAAWALEQEAVA